MAGAAVAAPVFLLLSASAHAHIISLMIALKYLDSYKTAL